MSPSREAIPRSHRVFTPEQKAAISRRQTQPWRKWHGWSAFPNPVRFIARFVVGLGIRRVLWDVPPPSLEHAMAATDRTFARPGRTGLGDAQQRHVENERLVFANVPLPFAAVRQRRSNYQLPFAAWPHSNQTNIPSGDDRAPSKRKLNAGRGGVRIEHLPRCQPTGVQHTHNPTANRLDTCPRCEILDVQPIRCGPHVGDGDSRHRRKCFGRRVGRDISVINPTRACGRSQQEQGRCKTRTAKVGSGLQHDTDEYE